MSDTSFDLPVDRDRLVSVHRRVAHGLIEQTSETQGGPPRGGGGLYSTADDYLKLLRLFLNDGVANGQQLLQPHTVEQMRRNQIGALYAQLQTTAAPEATNDFIYMDGTQKFGFGFMIETRDQALGRAAGSYSWGGILNTFFWVDPRTEIAALILMQVSPFADPVCVDLYRRFERAVYDYVV